MNEFLVTVQIGLYVIATSVNTRFSIIIFWLEAGLTAGLTASLTAGLLSSCFRLQFCMNVSRHSGGVR